MKTTMVLAAAGLAAAAAAPACLAQSCDPFVQPVFARTFASPTLTRGYWFTAPLDFTICGLEVPNESGQAMQNVEVVRFDGNAPPPAWPTTTNAFVSLFRSVGQPANSVIPCDVAVLAGEVIGVLGACGTATMSNSYGPAGVFNTIILGQPATLTRMGMQFNLFTSPAQAIWTEVAFEVSRVHMHVRDSASCYPDCDTSTGVGVLDIFDFLCFQNRYDVGSAYACDCDTTTGPGVCDIFDFLCFQNAYDAGCP